MAKGPKSTLWGFICSRLNHAELALELTTISRPCGWTGLANASL